MSPVGETANPALAPEAVLPAGTLNSGEIVILAIKPSPWFVLLASWPVAAAGVLTTLAAYAGGHAFRLPWLYQGVFFVSTIAVSARVVAACFQWMARVYVLTNRRLMWIYGITRVHVYDCPLKQIASVRLAALAGERALGLASLFFHKADGLCEAGGWLNIAQPKRVQDHIEQARRQAL